MVACKAKSKEKPKEQLQGKSQEQSKEKKRRARGRWKLWLALALALVVGLMLWIDAHLKPVVIRMAEAQCRSLAAGVLNTSIRTVLEDGVDYGDLMAVHFDSAGRVTMMQANTVRMNALSTRISREAREGLQKLNVARIGIPLGAALGSEMLAGEGPRIPVKVYPLGAVASGFSSEFESSGINQTRHKVFLKVTASIQIIIPTDAQMVSVAETVLVAESIIVGQVPERFYSTGNAALLDLAP